LVEDAFDLAAVDVEFAGAGALAVAPPVLYGGRSAPELAQPAVPVVWCIMYALHTPRGYLEEGWISMGEDVSHGIWSRPPLLRTSENLWWLE
jgi:hypothetical protein